MSYTQNNLRSLLDEVIEKQSRQAAEVSQLRHIKSLFKESEKAREAKQVAFSVQLLSLREKFSGFFGREPQTKGAAI